MNKHVAIIGGGVAGLTSAFELVREHCRVTLLEAKDRVGGRMHTLNDGSYPIELGAEFVHGPNACLEELLRAASLTTHEVPDRNRVRRGSRLEPVPLWDRMSRMLAGANPREADQSFQEFARSLDPDSRELGRHFVEGFHAAHPGRISLHALLRAEHAQASGRQWRVHQGYSALARFLEREIRSAGAALWTDAVVRSVHWKPGHVELRVDRNGRGERLTADAAIITLPLGVLKSGAVAFVPALSNKEEAIRELEFGAVRKLTLVFEERWWPEADFGFVHDFNAPIPTWWSDPRGPFVTGWAGGPKAEALADRSPAQLKQLALETLLPIFDARASGIGKQLLAVHSHDWANDPYARGAYSFIPVNGLDLPRLLAEPLDDTLFFAGEATVRDAQCGTVSGALETGKRAAAELLGVHVR